MSKGTDPSRDDYERAVADVEGYKIQLEEANSIIEDLVEKVSWLEEELREED